MRDLAKGRQDVELHVPFVPSVGRSSEMQLLAWQPLAGEVRTERQRSDRTDLLGLGSRQFLGEPFRFGLVGAGRVPRSALFAGDRVAAFVDHGVVAVASLSHVALHGVLLQTAFSTIETRRNNR